MRLPFRGAGVLAHRSTLAGLTAGLFASVLVVCGCNKEQKADTPAGQRPAVPVLVAPVVRKDMPVEIISFGNVEAYATVSAKAQVNGTLQTVHIEEGQVVEANQLLLSIDPRPYEAAVKQAEANLARDKVQGRYADEDANRVAVLLKKGIGTQDEYDQARTKAEVAKAVIQADEAAVTMAKLQVEYCTIRSPFKGRMGQLLLDQGTLIKANDVPILTINRTQPIYVTFTVPQDELSRIRRQMKQRSLEVRALLPGEPNRPELGTLTFIDNQVDANTGTIRLKGTFQNTEERLWPGLYVDTVLKLSTEPNVIVVPSQAVQLGQRGQYVYILKDDMTVEQRRVKVLRTLGEESIIEDGLQPGQKVVTDGQFRLTDGAKAVVRLPEKGAESRPGSAAPTRPAPQAGTQASGPSEARP